MVIEKRCIGASGKTIVYEVCADATETGGRMKTIARFDTLETATAVMRYMRGDSLSEADTAIAKEAIRKADAPTDKSKRDRSAAK